jgi:hypothetical protein
MALAMRKSLACTKRPAQDRPSLNLYDIPEVMAGAQPSANSVERERFNQRCRKLWEDDDGHAFEECQNHGQDETVRYSQLEKMFPELDPELIWSMCCESSNMQQIADTLLALSASMTPDTGQMEQQTSKEVVPHSDGSAWPALLDSDGWEVVNYQALQQQDHDLGTSWCKAAKDAAPLPSPRPSRGTSAQTKHNQKESPGAMDAMGSIIEEDCFPTDYEMRHMRGQERATKLATKCMLRVRSQNCKFPSQESKEREQLASESGDSVETVPELYA